MEQVNYDIAIVGAGPAGLSAAIFLAEKGYKIALIDKKEFPKDKACGGAVSDRSLNVLSRMPNNLYQEFMQIAEESSSLGLRLFAPNYHYFDIKPKPEAHHQSVAYIIKRKEFDNFLFESLMRYKNVQFHKAKIKSVQISSEKASLDLENLQINTKIVVGADGTNSFIAKKLLPKSLSKPEDITAVRVFYENISGFDSENLAELHYIKNLVPFYFWIFPLPNNQYNVGLGLSKEILKKKGLKLHDILHEIIEKHPQISERFKNAKQISEVKAHNLPIFTNKERISGERFLLVGDAASMVDPLFGEGIGNALLSGELAAYHIDSIFDLGDFSAKNNLKYDQNIYKKMWAEVQIHYRLTKFFTKPFWYNYLIKKAGRSKYFQNVVNEMLENDFKKKKLLNPLFYARLIFS